MTRHYLDILADVIRENWDKPALSEYDCAEQTEIKSLSYGQLNHEIKQLTKTILSLTNGEKAHVGFCGSNSVNWIISFLASAYADCINIPIPHSLSTDDIVSLIEFTDIQILFTDNALFQEIKGILPTSRLRAIISIEDFTITNYHNTLQKSDIQTAASLICFTSGSSNTAKAVALSSKSIDINVNYVIQTYKSTESPHYLAVFPFSHLLSLMGSLLKPLCLGGRVFIYSNDLFTPQEFLRSLSKIRPCEIVLVPMLMETIISPKNKDILLDMLSYVVNFTVAGASVPIKIEEKLRRLHVPIVKAYGMTECGPLISTTTHENDKLGTVGKIIPSIQGKIDFNGEILVRGENVMLGYYKDPEATAAKIDKDGWLHTGDRGHLDEDGYLYVEGRLEQDMIVLPSGENISPAKVEAIINACDGVEESIVIARDGKLMALVVPTTTTTSTTTRNELLAQINPQLPAYSQLFGIEFLSTPLARTEKKTIKRYLYK